MSTLTIAVVNLRNRGRSRSTSYFFEQSHNTCIGREFIMSERQFAVSPASGPVVVTGAKYIEPGLSDCVEKGYEVRACVRDTSNSQDDHPYN